MKADGLPHGTINCYHYYRCRCVLCCREKEAYAERRQATKCRTPECNRTPHHSVSGYCNQCRKALRLRAEAKQSGPSDTRTVMVYALRDPRDASLRYVGQSGDTPTRRLEAHLSEARCGKATRKADWVRAVMDAGERPELIVLAVVPHAQRLRAEKEWIDELRAAAWPLTNAAHPGKQLLAQ